MSRIINKCPNLGGDKSPCLRAAIKVAALQMNPASKRNIQIRDASFSLILGGEKI